MALTWIREAPATWDEAKARIIGGAPAGAFDETRLTKEGVLPGEWWRVERDGRTVGFGWMDLVWGDAEILLAVDPAEQGGGVGAFILHRLTREASSRGVRRLYNTVREGHVDGARVTRWLLSHGFVTRHGANQLDRPVPAA
jgi:N-acetylglutamate synthase-like GNAT family acetyltransferase